MKLTLKREDEFLKVSAKESDDINFSYLLDLFIGLAVTYGYSQELINRVIQEKAMELDTNHQN